MTRTNKNRGKFYSFLIVLLSLLVGSGNMAVFALGDNPDWRAVYLSVTYTGHGHTEPYPMRQWVLSDTAGGPGEVAFCVEVETDMFGDFNHYRGTLIDSLIKNYGFSKEVAKTKAYAVAKAIRQGWLTQAKTEENYAITQLAVWNIIGPHDIVLVGIDSAKITALTTYAQDTSTAAPSFHNQTLSLAVGESQVLTDTNKVITRLMELNGYTLGVEKQPAGQPYALTLMANDQLKVRLVNPVTTSTFGLSIPATDPATLVAYVSEPSQDTVLGSMTVQDPANLRLNITLTAGEMQITKINPPNTPLTGVKFALNDGKGNLVKFVQNSVGNYSMSASGTVTELLPNTSGKVLLKDLVPDTYKLTETGVFPGTYTASIGSAAVQSGNRTEVTVTNMEQTGTLTLTKMAEQFTGWTQSTQTYTKKDSKVQTSEKPQAGKVLKLMRKKTEVTLPTSLPTTPAPTITIAPAPAPTTAATTAAPTTEATTEATTEPTTAATTPAEPAAVAPTEAETVAETVAETEATTTPETTPSGAAGGGGSANSVTLELVKELTSDASGKVEATGLAAGYYVLYDEGRAVFEGDVVEGGSVSYTLPTLKTEQVVETPSTVSATVNTPGFSNKPLEGAVFGLYAAANVYALDGTTLKYAKGAQVKTATTDAAGKITMSGIPLGKYEVREISAPDGYVKDTTPIPVEFTAAAPTVEVITKNLGTVTNRRIKLSAIVTKQVLPSIFGAGAGAMVMSDVTFGVYTQALVEGLAKDSLVGIVKPDAAGKITLNDMLEGKYYLRELTTNTRYDLNPDNYLVEIKRTSETEENQVITTGTVILNAPSVVALELVKLDEETKDKLAGAVFELNAVKPDGTLVPILDGSGSNKYVSSGEGIKWNNLEEGKYQLTEVEAPAGYVNENKVIDVLLDKSKGEVIRIEVNNKKTHIEITKYDVRTGKQIEGAVLALVDADGKELERWTTDGNPHVLKGLLVGKAYAIKEVSAAAGYVKIDSIEFVVENNIEGQNVLVGNQKTEVQISKKDATTGKELPGASMTITDADGNVIASWTSGTEPYVIYGLEVDKTYTLHEDLAPLGYATASSVTFVIKNTADQQKVEMIDDVTKVELSKKDATNGKELPGAAMQLLDDKGKVVESWTSGDKPHIIKKLEVGKTYTLHEDLAPLGYAVASDVKITVKDTADVQKVEMIDDITRVTITKTDITNGKPVPGAEIEVKNEKGKVVFKGTTDKDGKTTIERLEAGKTYTFKETVHPFGYTLNKETFTFKIDKFGKVTGQTTFSDEPTRFEIKKLDEKGEAMKDVGFQLFTDNGDKITWRLEKGIYIADAKGTLDTVTSSQHGDIFMQYLPTGKYTLKETVTPKGYKPMKDLAVELKDDHGISNALKLTVKNEKLPEIPKTGENGAGNALAGAGGALALALASVMAITKKRRKTRI